ncbi:GAF domain-containing protein [bacterium]|nr:GAF domain-containing protein [bacterium]
MSARTQEQYDSLFRRLDSLCAGEGDAVALMATIACELRSAFSDFHWVGFYRAVGDRTLKIGPYQGGHGCLTIPFDKGVCGQCAREQRVINVTDVTAVPHHIACSGSTRSEIVVPIVDGAGALLAVLDVDSDLPAAFAEADERNLPLLNKYFRTTT